MHQTSTAYFRRQLAWVKPLLFVLRVPIRGSVSCLNWISIVRLLNRPYNPCFEF